MIIIHGTLIACSTNEVPNIYTIPNTLDSDTWEGKSDAIYTQLTHALKKAVQATS
eukprot:CAMPEP_0202339734 /NCGR_PEP_ID=MMETSP1126-20121109/1470_1 /ASSEMBLY_ACC=CAM_ASM_000457 /TAXON_ID=3047 /ORGANISM="Dunaliella tertiolecta, Strain CCMP1320" /LENGTH=54 /DNA_ID=CAMNT_0048930329 /DNA_START=41 /DNA_END=205 /DNA_ORIENTATION=+